MILKWCFVFIGVLERCATVKALLFVKYEVTKYLRWKVGTFCANDFQLGGGGKVPSP
jgi:hypothetical protein